MNTGDLTRVRHSIADNAMAANSPAYQEVVSRCVAAARGWPLGPGARVLDAGAGTGDISIPLALELPQCTVIHLEPDSEMCDAARTKAAQAGVTNLEFLQCDLASANFLPGSMSAIVSVHRLYAAADPRKAIRVLADWLAPGGRLFAWDAGGRAHVSDWARYILAETRRRQGWLAALKVLWSGRVQNAGKSWLHDSAGFRAGFEGAGLMIEDSCDGNRACGNLVVCRKPDV